jgi:hypothetical protein
MPDEVVAAAPAAPAAAPATAPTAPPAGETPAAAAAETPAVPPGEKPAAPDDDPAKQDRARHRRQLNTAYRKAAEAQARADLLQKQIEELRPKAPATTATPRLEDFKDIEEYATAKAKHEAEKAVQEHQAKQQSESQKQAQAKLIEQWEEKVDAAADKYPDWTEVVGEVKPTRPWAIAAMEADNGPDILYHLGKNLDEARRINSLSPTAQIREIGKLEVKLAAEAPKPKAPSRAPAPITPLAGTAPVASDVPSDQDDIKTWMRKRNKQVHGSKVR